MPSASNVDPQIVIDTTNFIIAILSGLILFWVQRMLRWTHSVNKRLDKIERRLGIADDDGEGRVEDADA